MAAGPPPSSSSPGPTSMATSPRLKEEERDVDRPALEALREELEGAPSSSSSNPPPPPPLLLAVFPKPVVEGVVDLKEDLREDRMVLPLPSPPPPLPPMVPPKLLPLPPPPPLGLNAVVVVREVPARTSSPPIAPSSP